MEDPIQLLMDEIRKILKKYIASTDKIEEIQNLIDEVEKGIEDATRKDVQERSEL